MFTPLSLIANARTGWQQSQPVRSPRGLLVSIAAAAAIGIGIAARLYYRFGPATYAVVDTLFGKACIYVVADEQGRDVRLLEVGGVVHSGTYVDDALCYDLVFEYLKRYDALFDPPAAGLLGWDTIPISRMLVLGCGGYDYPEHVVAHYPQTTVDAVEIDPAITALAQRYFYLDRCIEEFDTERTGRLNLITADARTVLRDTAAAGTTWDAIVNDLFDVDTPVLSFLEEDMLHTVYTCLSPGGIYATNVVAALEGPHAALLVSHAQALAAVFDRVDILPCNPDSLTEPDNVIVIAQKQVA